VLTAAVPEHGLEPGDVGTVVHVYADRQALEVEFTFLNGHTAVVATVEAPLFEPSPAETSHTRASSEFGRLIAVAACLLTALFPRLAAWPPFPDSLPG
jgi:hypothetical protein